MVKKEIIKKAILKKKKKKWVTIYASSEFNNIDIGETLVVEQNEVLGKTLEVNLADLTNDIKKQNILLTFAANKIQDQKVVCDIIGYELSPSYVKMVIKRARSKIEDSFLCSTKDDVKVRLKPVILTRSKAKGSILTLLRHKSRDYFVNNVKKQTYNEILADIMSHNLQKGLKEELKKIYPVSLTELRIFKKE